MIKAARVPGGVLLAMAALAAGCASPSPGPAGAGGPSPSASSPSSRAPATRPPGSGQPVTVRGTVQQGVAARCLVLRTDRQGSLVLVDGDRFGVRAGQTVTLRGVVRHDMVSYCQQGTPFVVAQVLAR